VRTLGGYTLTSIIRHISRALVSGASYCADNGGSVKNAYKWRAITDVEGFGVVAVPTTVPGQFEITWSADASTVPANKATEAGARGECISGHRQGPWWSGNITGKSAADLIADMSTPITELVNTFPIGCRV
jgi:hypothetical protein